MVPPLSWQSSGFAGSAAWGKSASRTPYYRHTVQQAGIAAGDLSECVESPAILEKATPRSEAEEMLTEPASNLFPVNTSGSPGIPLQLLRSQRDQAEVSALWARLGARCRRTFGPQASIDSGRAVAKKGPVVKLRELGILPQAPLKEPVVPPTA